MPTKYHLTIKTSHGSAECEMYANSASQLAANMPGTVTHYVANPLNEELERRPVGDLELWHELETLVDHIEYASTLDDAEIARLHADQQRAFEGLSLYVGDNQGKRV